MKANARYCAVHTQSVTIALPARLKRQVYDAAACKGLPASEFIRDAIERAASLQYSNIPA